MGLMLAYVLRHNESFLVHPQDPAWQHYLPFRWWLLPHGLAGACALLLGPMQFSDHLRRGFTKLHRAVGRIYLGGVFIVGPLGTYIQYFEERMGAPRSFSIAAAVDAALFILTTGIAFSFILQGKIQQHRQWMTRTFAVALVFLEVRVIGGVTGWESRHSRQRGNRMVLPRVRDPLGGHRTSVAGPAPDAAGSAKAANRYTLDGIRKKLLPAKKSHLY